MSESVMQPNQRPCFHLLTCGEEACKRYRHLTYPAYQSLLLNPGDDRPVIALGVSVDNLPAGLLLAKIETEPAGTRYACIQSLYVATEYRRSGLGADLLARAESELIRQQCSTLVMEYVSNINNVLLTRLFARNGWTIRTIGVVCRASRSKVLAAPSPHLLDLLTRLEEKQPADYQLFFWQTLSARQRSSLKNKMEQNQEYGRYTPFIDEELIESSNSLGLLYRDNVVGWIVTHRIAPNTIRYTRLFTSPDHRQMSSGLYLLMKSIQLHVDSCTADEDAFACWEFNPDNTPMLNLVQRRLKPYICEFSNVCAAVKSFGEVDKPLLSAFL